ncbi:MAG: hypothetical protein OK454_11200, partial [Thaumarchaeota archaeon]|nr:hypothetical protein [Nitrososphaerota archaeon]
GAPPEALRELFELSLMTGVEEFDMVMECATSLRNKYDADAQPFDSSLISCLDIIFNAQRHDGLGRPPASNAPRVKKRECHELEDKGGRLPAERPKKKRSVKNKSPFWDMALEPTERYDASTEPEPRGDAVRVAEAATKPRGRKRQDVTPKNREDEHDRRVDGAAGDLHPKKRKPKENSKQGLGEQEQDAEEEPAARRAEREVVPEKVSKVVILEPNEALRAPPGESRRRNKKAAAAKSPYFTPSPTTTTTTTTDTPGEVQEAAATPTGKRRRPPRGTVSALAFPPLTTERFGLAQEKVAHDPFRLLIAVTFLIRTPGRVAMPVFWDLMNRYPTPEALAAAEPDDIVEKIRHLGLG